MEKMVLGLLIMMGLMVSVFGCGKDGSTGQQEQTLEVNKSVGNDSVSVGNDSVSVDAVGSLKLISEFVRAQISARDEDDFAMTRVE